MRKLLLTCVIALVSAFVCAQPSVDLIKVIPPSPDAASLGKYGEIPVSKYTGVPNISIPIYQIKQSGIEIPISLSYHAGGLKVEELAGWAGLGWSLNAGGVITRTINGDADEKSGNVTGYLNQTYNIEDFSSYDAATQQIIYNKILNGELDVEPDVFSFNFLNQSGKFIIDKSTLKGVLIPKRNLDISFTLDNGKIGTWTVIDEAGFKYIFSTREQTYTRPYPFGPGSGPNVNNSSWYLDQVISANGEVVTFYYQDYSNEYFLRSLQTKNYYAGPYENECGISNNASPENTYIHQRHTGKKISRIEFKNGSVHFIMDPSVRQDIAGDDHALKCIEVRRKDNTVLKKFNFSYSYFSANSYGVLGLPPDISAITFTKKLRLDQVTEESAGISLPPYTFFYENGLAYPLSYAQDHWGFFNSAENTSLIPNFGLIIGGDANRAPYLGPAQAGILKKIQYPTGGSSSFEYELNEARIKYTDYAKYFMPHYSQADLIVYGYVNEEAKVSVFTVDYNDPNIPIDGPVGCYAAVYYGNETDCDPSTKDCIGTMQVKLRCLDCPDFFNLTTIGSSPNNNITLKKGRTYELRLSGHPDDIVGTSAVIKGPPNPQINPDGTYLNAKIGGLRIKQISTEDGTGNNYSKKYLYHEDENYIDGDDQNLTSSGRVVSFPRYDFPKMNIRKRVLYNGDPIYTLCEYTILTSHSQVPLITTSGSFVGYGMVQEVQHSGQEIHKSIHTFTTSENYADNISYTYPYKVIESNDWRRGLPLEQKDFLYQNNTFKLIHKKAFTYSFPATTSFYVPGLRLVCGGQGSNGECIQYIPKAYNERTEFCFTSRETEFFYPASQTESIKAETNFDYNLIHLQLQKITSLNSKGQIIEKNIRYAPDNINGLSATALAAKNEMNGRHMIGLPLEEEIINSGSPLNKVRNNYKIENTGFVFLQNIEHQQRSGPLEKRMEVPKYDAVGNVVEQRKADDVLHSYVWDYNATYPIAEVINAGTEQIAYTSFETAELGGWLANVPGQILLDGAITGTRSYTGSLTRTVNVPGNYILSFWSNGNSQINGQPNTAQPLKQIGNWNYFQIQLNNITSATVGGDRIDEVRLYPATAQMITYTYEPLVGVTSSSDLNGRITYYEYDAFGRLKLIRDQDGNILKTFEYKYRQQQ